MGAIMTAVCASDPADPASVRAGFPGGRLLEARVDAVAGRPGRSRHRILTPDGGEWLVSRLFPGGRLRRVTIEWHAPVNEGQGRVRPEMSVNADARCQITEGRRIIYANGQAERLMILGPDVKTVVGEEPLNPPVPPAPPVASPVGSPKGSPEESSEASPDKRVRVALIDTGVNYTLPLFRGRLARDEKGALIGYDFWDMDSRPFDVDAARSVFFPLRHGTAVASVLLREAPGALLLPYRYPRPDMSRFADLIAHADRNGAMIVNLAMGSNDAGDWRAFETAAKARPHMLFIVSAGNDGRDIGRAPIYPAASKLKNVLTVTSSDDWGRLAAGSNWGAADVDVMTPGEGIPVTDHRGAPGKASGSSFAVPRVTALAARFKVRHPEWTGPELKAAILKRARTTQDPGGRRLRHGWIPDPTDDFEG